MAKLTAMQVAQRALEKVDALSTSTGEELNQVRNRILDDRAALTNYSGQRTKVLMQDGTPFFLETSTATIDGVYILGVMGISSKRWIGRPSNGLLAYLYPNLQAALNAGANTAQYVRLQDREIVRCTTTITINSSYTKLVGFGSSLLFSDPNLSVCVYGTGQGGGAFLPYKQTWCGIDGVSIRHTNVDNKSIGLYLDTAKEPGTSHAKFTNVNIDGFERGLVTGRNTYINTIIGGDIINCGVCMDILPAENAGERLTVIDTNMFNSLLGIRNGNPDGKLKLMNVSLDYNAKQIEINQGTVEAHGCHIEGKNYTNPIITTGQASGSTFQMFGGDLVCTTDPDRPDDPRPESIFEVGKNENAGVSLWGVFMHNLQTKSGYLKTGGGFIEAHGSKFYDNTLGVTALSKEHNLLTDGFFQQASLIDAWVINDEGSRVSRILTDQNELQIVVDPYSPTEKCLEWTKKYGGGTPAHIDLFVPVTEGEHISFLWQYAKNNNRTGRIFATYKYGFGGFENGLGGLDFLSIQELGTNEIPLLAYAMPWKGQGIPMRRVPWGATHFIFTINGFDFDGGSVVNGQPVGGSLLFKNFHCSAWGSAKRKPALGLQFDSAKRNLAIDSTSQGVIPVATYAAAATLEVTKYTQILVQEDEKTGRQDVLYYKTPRVFRQQGDVEYVNA